MTRQEYSDKLWFLRLVSSTWLQTRGVIHVRGSKNYTERLVKYAQLAVTVLSIFPRMSPHLQRNLTSNHTSTKRDFYVAGATEMQIQYIMLQKRQTPQPPRRPFDQAPCHPLVKICRTARSEASRLPAQVLPCPSSEELRTEELRSQHQYPASFRKAFGYHVVTEAFTE